MRIGIDASLVRPETFYTGMGQHVRGLLQGLAGLDCADEIVLLSYELRPRDVPARFNWFHLQPLRLGKPSLWLSHQVLLGQTARALELDVLHVPGVNIRLSGPSVPLRVPCPLVVTLHDAIPLTYYGSRGPRLPWRLRFAFRVALAGVRRAAAVITVSETSRRALIRHTRIEPERLHVVYNGVDFPEAPDPGHARAILERLGITESYLLSAGSYEPRKNLLGAVDAYREAWRHGPLPPLVLLVERESGWKAGVMQAVAASGVADHLTFLHSLPDDEMAALYHNATLFLYPSYDEGFGLPPAQALACGVPVIASKAGSLPEILGDAASYVDPASTHDLAAAIVRLLSDPEVAQTISSRGPAQAARYQWVDAARETLAVLEYAANRGSETGKRFKGPGAQS
jgi:glycosyltransferase involved in cell wall biosynthesis